MSGRRDLSALWAAHVDAASLSDAGGQIGRAVIGRYALPWRRYHGLGHLRFLFGEIARLQADITDIHRVRFAAWFHDAIYVSWRKDNEARSARWARLALARMGADDALSGSVARLIAATADHAGAAPTDGDDALFLDMDMAILGAPPDLYDRYARQVRLEYAWAPGPLYSKGRAGFLTAQLNRDRIFHTDCYEIDRAGQARANMARELARVQAAQAGPYS